MSSSIPSWSPTASCALPIWSAASGSSPRPIVGSVAACTRTSLGPSSKRWRRVRLSPAASSGADLPAVWPPAAPLNQAPLPHYRRRGRWLGERGQCGDEFGALAFEHGDLLMDLAGLVKFER